MNIAKKYNNPFWLHKFACAMVLRFQSGVASERVVSHLVHTSESFDTKFIRWSHHLSTGGTGALGFSGYYAVDTDAHDAVIPELAVAAFNMEVMGLIFDGEKHRILCIQSTNNPLDLAGEEAATDIWGPLIKAMGTNADTGPLSMIAHR